MAAAILALRLALAAVFAVAGGAKLADREGSRRAVRDFGVPDRLATPLAFLLPFSEIAIAAGLVPAASARVAAAAGAALLVLFAVAICIALLRGRRPDCHCFGQLHSAPAGPVTLVRNASLAGLAVFIAAQSAGEPGWVELAAVGAAVVVVGQAVLSYLLLRRYGRALLRIEELEAGLGQPATLPVGAEAPDFALPDLYGQVVELGRLLARKRPTLLVFADPGCGPCRALMPELAAWQREHADRLTVALISRGDQFENAVTEEHGLHTVLLQVDREVAELYRSDATPSAVLVGVDERIAHELVTGAEAISGLVDFATSPSRPDGAPAANGTGRIAVAAALAGGLAAAAPDAVASTGEDRALPASDPELEAIETAIRKANPKIGADLRRIRLALTANAVRRGDRTALRDALLTMRGDALAVRSAVLVVPVSGARARQAKQLASRFFLSLADALKLFARSVSSNRLADEHRLAAEGQKRFATARSYGYAANLVLGCKGRGC